MSRRSVCLAVALLTAGVDAQAQLSAQLHVGAVYTSSLVRDSILHRITLRPDIGPHAAGTVGWQLTPRWRVDGDISVGHAGLTTREAGKAREINSLTTLAATVGGTASLISTLDARAGLGLIHHIPAEAKGVFLHGSTTHLLGAAAVSYYRPVHDGWAVGAELRYELHTFSSPALRARGFVGERTVHRLGVGLSLERRWTP